ncbi:uncharacterized protein LOC129280719 isoform X2 [Lytechinus pictus]|uniref:uncharacterized protein LOC129280719 isoform X2 n=1 Tax=Lytechinus pictus TaxID=7653 RepID=UPI0030B9CF4E
MSSSVGDPSHLELLKLLCRLCGERIRKKHGEYSVGKYKDTLAKIGIDVAQDDPNVHPPSFCVLCCIETNAARVTCGKGKERRDKWKAVWNKHTEDGTCLSCTKAENSKKGGRPKLIKRSGRPRLDPAIAEERQKNQTRMPPPPPTVMTLRSGRKTRATEEIQNCPTSTAAIATAPISVAPGVNPPKAGYPKFRKLAPKGAHEGETPITGTPSALLNTTVSQRIQGMQATPFPQSQNCVYVQSLSGMQTPVALNINPQNQANIHSLAPSLYLIPGTSGIQGLPSTPLQTLNGIPIIQSLQQPLLNPVVQTAGVIPNLLTFVQPSGILCSLPAAQPIPNQPLQSNPLADKREGSSAVPITSSNAKLSDTSRNITEESDENSDISLSSFPEVLETSAKNLVESVEDVLPSSNTEFDREPQELRRFVLPSSLEKTIQINAFHNHDAEIKCKKCQKMIPLVNIDEHEFECVTPSLALHDHNYMFHGEKERRGRRKRKDDSGDQMPEAQEEEPLTDMVLIERSVLEELERRAKRNMQD